MAETMAHDHNTARRPYGIDSSTDLLAITTMTQFDNKSFEELRLDDHKAGEKGQNLQTATNQPSAVPISTKGSSAIGSRMIIEDNKSTST